MAKGDTHNAYSIMRFLRDARQGKEITLFGGGEEYRDHVHVDDVARIIFEAHTRHITGEYNIASGRSMRFADIAATIAKAIPGTTITHKPRAIPITHRHMNVNALWRMFPGAKPRSIATGLRELLA